MQNKSILLLLGCLIFGCVNQFNKKKGVTINENTEWTQSWIVNTNDTKLPKALIIGDSHAERYYGIVANNLKSHVSCSKFTTSKSLGDPIFIAQLELILKQYKFDIITFNNGLHGEDYSIEAYSSYVSVAYNLLNNNAKKSVILINSTAIREKSNLNEFAPRNKQIIERNNYISNFAKDNNISFLDFYSKTAYKIDCYTSDGVHFNAKGVNIEATLITQEIAKKLNLNLF